MYYLHTAERFYPCDFGDVMRHCDLMHQRGDVVETIIHYPHLNSGTLHAEPDALREEGIELAPEHVDALSWQPVDHSYLGNDATAPGAYSYVVSRPGAYFFRLHDTRIIHGNVSGGATEIPTYFSRQDRGGAERTSFENGFEFCPRGWLTDGSADEVCQECATEVLRHNRALQFSPNPQYCTISVQEIGGQTFTDLIYQTFFAMNGSISFLPGVGTHVVDIEVVGIRFKGTDVTTSSRPFRYYFAQHAGFSWYEPKDCEHISLEDARGSESDHLVVYLARESHEAYPRSGVWQRIFGFANDLCDQGVQWTPPARYVKVPTGSWATKVQEHYAEKRGAKNSSSVMLIPASEDDRGPEWYYSITAAHVPGAEGMPPSNTKKILLPESGFNGTDLFNRQIATTKAGSHSEPGTYIDESVPENLACAQAPKTPHEPADPSATEDVTPGTGPAMPIRTRGYLDRAHPAGVEILASVRQLLPLLSGEAGLIAALLPEPLLDGHQPGWDAQSKITTGVIDDEADYPIWYHKENCGPFDLQVWLHSTQSLKRKHPGDESKGYLGGIRAKGFEDLQVTIPEQLEPETRSFAVDVALEPGKEITLTANAEVVTKPNRGGFSVGNPHVVATITLKSFAARVTCDLQVPIAVPNVGVTRYCIDETGRPTPDSMAIGWFVPNIQWLHVGRERFAGIEHAENYSTTGLPPDASLSEEESKRLLSFTARIEPDWQQLKYDVDVDFIGLFGGKVPGTLILNWLNSGSLGDLATGLYDLVFPKHPVRVFGEDINPADGVHDVVAAGLRAALASAKTPPLIPLILDGAIRSLEKELNRQVMRLLLDHPPKV